MDDPAREATNFVYPGGSWVTPVVAASSSNRPSTQLEGLVGVPFRDPWFREDTIHDYLPDATDWNASADHVPSDLAVREYAQALVRRAFARGLGRQGQTVPTAQRRQHAEGVLRHALRAYVRRRYGTAARQRTIGRRRSARRAPARARRRR